MVEKVTNQNFGDRVIRSTTPPMEIPFHKIASPSEGKSDLMLLPTVSVSEKERIEKFLKNIQSPEVEPGEADSERKRI
jgi:hypothetical protein